jgi:type II secretory pathway predicted ATPase ExeA
MDGREVRRPEHLLRVRRQAYRHRPAEPGPLGGSATPSGSYERYGLTGNPFRELASESLDDVTIYHVNQASDTLLRTIFDEVLEKENRAVVVVTGPQGAGKTQRLLLAASTAKEHKAFTVYFDVTTQGAFALQGLSSAFEKGAKEAGLVRLLGSPSWLRGVSSLAKTKGAKYDPKEAGRKIGEALNATAPSFLLLNDLHNLSETAELEAFAKTLEEVTGVIKPGVLLMFTCYASYLAWMTANQPGFASRINRTIPLVGLSDDEARLVLAKKMLAKRIVEDLEPTYPFDREAVHELNVAARGNPRRLIELADTVLERAVSLRAYQIDGDLARSSLLAREGGAPSSPPIWQETPATGGTESEQKDAPKPAVPVARRSIWGKSR